MKTKLVPNKDSLEARNWRCLGRCGRVFRYAHFRMQGVADSNLNLAINFVNLATNGYLFESGKNEATKGKRGLRLSYADPKMQ